ncbi:MAG TPA: zinc ribbon domain-containing protein [Anaerolineales bacterium]|nr:zinc ribbon domain-containing protein [Anaerolineales bacterium]
METKIYHGNLTPAEIANKLIAAFNRGNLRAQQIGDGDQVIVQIATDRMSRAGGQTAMTVTLQQVDVGVSVQVGQQNWLGVAASLGTSALAALRSPFNLLGRLDDIAQDIESMQLQEKVMETIQAFTRSQAAGHELSERLRRMVCDYCNTANPVGEPRCIACGAPLGDVQPRTCLNCGFVVRSNETNCPNCQKLLPPL